MPKRRVARKAKQSKAAGGGEGSSKKSKDDDPPIMKLPDDVLKDIFSLITNIPSKMQLEQVCKRFNRVGKLSGSWKGIHSLEMNLQCTGRSRYMSDMAMNFSLDCGDFHMFDGVPKQPQQINAHDIPLTDWPSAIKMLLERTKIDRLSLHIENKFKKADEHPAIGSIGQKILPVLRKFAHQVKLSYLELHLHSIPGFGDTLTWLFNHNAETLRTLKLSDEDSCGEYGELCLAAVNKCHALEAVSIYELRLQTAQLVSVLDGKHLTELNLASYFVPQGELPESLGAVVCNGVAGSGIRTLSLTCGDNDVLDLNFFASQLNERSSQALERLFIDDFEEMGLNHYLPFLPQLPQKLPALKFIHFEAAGFTDTEKLDENALLTTGFFDAVNNAQSSITCRVVFTFLLVDDKDSFRSDVEDCHVAEAEFGEEEGDVWVTLSRGNASIVIEDVEEYTRDERR